MKLYEPFQFLTAAECDDIIRYSEKQTKVQAKTTIESNARKNRIVWYKETSAWKKWVDLFNSVNPVIDWIQTPQISFYRPGEEYKWHRDTWPKYRTHIRHLTLTCELQPAVGGRIELRQHHFPPLSKGQAIIFKWNDLHRATSPKHGERISFTIWAMTKNPNKR